MSRLEATAFLASLHAAYVVSTGRPHGVVAKLLELYRVLTYRPHARQRYPREAFAHDLYTLDRYTHALTVERPFRLHPGATAARNRRNLVVVTTDDGVEHTYYAIEFFE